MKYALYNSFDAKEILKNHDAKWDAERKAWIIESAEWEKIQNNLARPSYYGMSDVRALSKIRAEKLDVADQKQSDTAKAIRTEKLAEIEKLEGSLNPQAPGIEVIFAIIGEAKNNPSDRYWIDNRNTSYDQNWLHTEWKKKEKP